VTERCRSFLAPFLAALDRQVDRRLVRTAAATVTALVRHRNRSQALLLSELGAYLAGPRHAPAGTKRLANLVHSRRWSAEVIDTYLCQRARTVACAEAERVSEGRALCILDGSVLEKPESTQGAGLRPVRSSKGRRVRRPRPALGPGYYRGPLGSPTVVPGLSWTAALVTGWAERAARRPVALAAWRWSGRGSPRPAAAPAELSPARATDWAALQPVVAACGTERLLHVWDRGLCGAAWLGVALEAGWHFVVRFKKGTHLRRADARSLGWPQAPHAFRAADGIAAWRLTAGLRAWGERQLSNPREPQRPLTIAFAARPVRLVTRDEPLWLVVARVHGPRSHRGTREPWRLLTTEPVETAEQCWRIVQAYAARWAIEQHLRFSKSDLGIESVRVRAWESRRKLLGLVSLAYAFLVDLLDQGATAPDAGTEALASAVLRWAHRTGRQARTTWRSLYRLRLGLSFLWNAHTPNPQELGP
jgi:hypothetical protein